MRTIGQAVAKVLLHPEATANRNICISSYEVSLNEILELEKQIVGQEGWKVTYVDPRQEIEEATKDWKETGNIFAMGRLALCSLVADGAKADMAERGTLNNELLGLSETESIKEAVGRVLGDEKQAA